MRRTALVAVALAALALAAVPAGVQAKPKPKPPAIPKITANPVDLATVTKISRFRSCSGHDYSPGFGQKKQGLPVTGEIARSMKHYIDISNDLADVDAVKGYAPFAGTIRIESEQYPLGKQVIVQSPSGWIVKFFHGDPLVTDGAKVTPGQQIIAWPPAGAKDLLGAKDPNKKMEFDISMENYKTGAIVSIFSAMTPQVAALWAAKGFTAANAIISKEARDADPCHVGPDGEFFTDVDAARPDNWVQATG